MSIDIYHSHVLDRCCLCHIFSSQEPCRVVIFMPFQRMKESSWHVMEQRLEPETIFLLFLLPMIFLLFHVTTHERVLRFIFFLSLTRCHLFPFSLQWLLFHFCVYWYITYVSRFILTCVCENKYLCTCTHVCLLAFSELHVFGCFHRGWKQLWF